MERNAESIIQDEQELNDGAEAGQTKAAAGSASDALQEENQALKAELAGLKDRYLRQAADFQNFRKRAIEERALSVDIGKTQVALPMIDVLDDLRRSVKAAEDSDDPFAEGMRLVYEKFVMELAKLGIRGMNVMGEQFDEERHEALMQRNAPEGKSPGTILAEIQKGYMMDDKVLRHARVVVAK